MSRIITVLRSGGEYREEHVLRLRDQLAVHGAGDLICLSDVPVDGVETIPLRTRWPGWWAKMELFRPDITGDLLFMDLDTAIVGDITGFLDIGKTAILRDMYRVAGLQSSLMYLAAPDRDHVWRSFNADPKRWMSRHAAGGDQAFLEAIWRRRRPVIWQDELPGQVVSWKVHVRPAVRRDREFGDGSLPADARIVVFHGRPRPWEVGW